MSFKKLTGISCRQHVMRVYHEVCYNHIPAMQKIIFDLIVKLVYFFNIQTESL